MSVPIICEKNSTIKILQVILFSFLIIFIRATQGLRVAPHINPQKATLKSTARLTCRSSSLTLGEHVIP